MKFILLTLLSGSLFKYKTPNKASFLLFTIGILLHYTNAFTNWQNIKAHDILIFMLPPLIYYSAAHIDIHILKQFLKQLFILNGPILLLSIGSVAFCFSFLENFSWKVLLLFGTIVSATDPVTVVEIMEHLNMSKKIKTLIDGEALLNDEIVYLVYSLLLLDDETEIVWKLFYIPFGSILLSCSFFFVLFNVLRKIHDSDIEITLTIVFCYGCFYIAEEIHLSGIFAIVILGLWMAYLGKTSFSSSIKKSMEHVWETLDTNMNHMILVLSGLIGMKTISYLSTNWYKLLIIFVLINVIRISLIMLFSPLLVHEKYRISYKELILLGMSNIKGAITIILALELTEHSIVSDLFLFYVYGIVFLSLVVNPLVVEYFIHYGIKHEYDETVEYILHIRNRLEQVGCDVKQSLFNKSKYLKNINWKDVEKNMIKPKNISRSKKDNQVIQIESEVEFRVIYLMSLKQSFWRLFDDHQLYRDSLVKLLDIVDYILDSQDKHWESCFEPYCSVPVYCKWVPKYHAINHRHNILHGYVLGQEYTLENLNTIFEMDCNIIKELKLEMEKSIFKAKQILGQIEETYQR